MTTSSPMKGKVSTNRSLRTALVIRTPQPVCPSSTGSSGVRLLFQPLGDQWFRRRRSMSFMLAVALPSTSGSTASSGDRSTAQGHCRSTVNFARSRTQRIVASR
ncbi:hypothetical protein M514_11048 [Trichuris suis]|uniref:Uncharacterized protein n=1 Tax=Trichuris suis TaxID=68888 RepID=A0A085MW82_9BILA|nr:hypothetical protein M514_11048 [Trichuris suis]